MYEYVAFLHRSTDDELSATLCAGEMVDQTLPIASQLEQAVTVIKKQVKTVLDTKAEASASRKQVGLFDSYTRTVFVARPTPNSADSIRIWICIRVHVDLM